MTMKSTHFYIALCFILLGLLFWSCDKKFDLAVLPNPGQSTGIGDTNYVEILPPIGGFESPRAITVGNDQIGRASCRERVYSSV